MKDKDTIARWTAADVKKYRERHEFEAEKYYRSSVHATGEDTVGLGLQHTTNVSNYPLNAEEIELKRRWASEDQNHHANYKLDTTNFDWSAAQTASNTILSNLNFGNRQ